MTGEHGKHQSVSECAAELCHVAAQCYDITLDDKTAQQLGERLVEMREAADTHNPCLKTGNSGVSVWLKTRLMELGKLAVERGELNDVELFVLLHVFVNVRLPDDGGVLQYGEPARSKIVTGHRAPVPIDRVAHRVAPPPREHDAREILHGSGGENERLNQGTDS